MLTTIPPPSLGPTLRRVRVSVVFESTGTRGGVAVRLMARSAFERTVTVALAWSSSPALALFGVESGSRKSALATSAVNVLVPVAVALKVSPRVELAPFARLPTAQVRVPAV